MLNLDADKLVIFVGGPDDEIISLPVRQGRELAEGLRRLHCGDLLLELDDSILPPAVV